MNDGGDCAREITSNDCPLIWWLRRSKSSRLTVVRRLRSVLTKTCSAKTSSLLFLKASYLKSDLLSILAYFSTTISFISLTRSWRSRISPSCMSSWTFLTNNGEFFYDFLTFLRLHHLFHWVRVPCDRVDRVKAVFRFPYFKYYQSNTGLKSSLTNASVLSSTS